jgi:membrane associated rhomboid family serine protease
MSLTAQQRTSPAARASEDRRRGLIFVAAMAAVMWVVEVVNAIDGYSLDAYGIRPRATDGLDGVVFSPFLHASWGHLIGNTVPFLVLGAVIALSGLARVVLVTIIVAVVGGPGTWLVAPSNTVHIGASGVVFGYAAYLVARGIFNRRISQVLVGVLVIGVWGSALLGGLLPQDGISWQGHLFGAVGGIVAARLLAPKAAERPTGPAATRV